MITQQDLATRLKEIEEEFRPLTAGEFKCIMEKLTMTTTVTMTDEQFKELIQTIRGPQGGSIVTPTLPEDNEMCMRFAMELLQTIGRDTWYGDTSDRPKWKTLRAEIMKIAREYI